MILNIYIISCTKIVFKVLALTEDQYNCLFRTGEKYLDQLRTAQRILNRFVFFPIWFVVCLLIYSFLSRFVVWLVLFLISFPFFYCFDNVTVNFSDYLLFGM
jgi:hypothetical protein